MSVNKITMAVVAALFVAPLVVPEAHAINAHYRDQLIKSGCTQITESNGTCDIHKTKAQNQKAASKLKAYQKDADYVFDTKISDAAEYLLKQGWKANNGAWHKDGYTMKLSVANEIVVDTEITK